MSGQKLFLTFFMPQRGNTKGSGAMVACQLHWYFLLFALKSGLGLNSVHLCDFFS